MRNSEELKQERDKVVKGLELAYERLVEHKRKVNSPFVVMKNGKIVELDPHEVAPKIQYKRRS